jgi:hypothetical protein
MGTTSIIYPGQDRVVGLPAMPTAACAWAADCRTGRRVADTITRGRDNDVALTGGGGDLAVCIRVTAAIPPRTGDSTPLSSTAPTALSVPTCSRTGHGLG